MDAASWERVAGLFEELYFDTPAPERDARIASVSGGDPELERELRRLIAAAESGGPLDHRPELAVWGLDMPPDADTPGFHVDQLLSGRFRLLRLLGQGGMGQVWEALDEHLGVKRALKTIRPEVACDGAMIDRFKREVERSQAVTHPNVCRVYDLYYEAGVPLLSMELLSGESLAQRLRGEESPLPETEALAILRQCAAALDAAHQAGLVHRDFKPANVMLVEDSSALLRAVVTDFGLALPLASAATQLSTPGAGTPAYMPPEQAGGGDVTPAADVYAFAVVACEVLTGKRPSEGGLDLLSRRRQRAFRRCLDPDPALRPVSCAAFLDQLTGGLPRWPVVAGLLFAVSGLGTWLFFAAGPTDLPVTSIAVVLMQATGTSSDAPLLSASFADSVSARLARQRRLRVVPAASAAQGSGYVDRIAEFARRVNARYVLLGRLRAESSRVQVNAQLLEPGLNRTVWARTFERPTSALPEIESAVALAALAQIGFGDPVAAPRAPPVNPEADRALRLARFHYSRRDPESVAKAHDYFVAAIGLEPDWAAPHIGLAQTLLTMAERHDVAPLHALPEARATINRALALDPDSAEAHAAEGLLAAVYSHDFEQAERSFRSAIELDPFDVITRQWYSSVLVRERRFDEALRESALALRLDPLSIAAYQNRAAVLLYSGRCDEVLDLAGQLADLHPGSYLPSILRGYCLARLGQVEAARPELERSLAYPRPPTMVLRMAAEAYLMLGDRTRAAELTSRLTALRQTGTAAVPASFLAFLHAAAGSGDEAFAWLERAWGEGDTFLSLLHVYPACESLRGDPRYLSFLARLGIRESRGSGSAPSPR